MTSPPSPPNRRRRRIVVAVAVLTLVSAVSWWFWPRGDARFVGKWRFQLAENDNPNEVSFVELSSNGAGASIIPDEFHGLYKWHVEGNRLIMKRAISNRFVLNAVNECLHLLSSIKEFTEEDPTVFELIEVRADKIRMRDLREPDTEFVLVRQSK